MLSLNKSPRSHFRDLITFYGKHHQIVEELTRIVNWFFDIEETQRPIVRASTTVCFFNMLCPICSVQFASNSGR